MKLCRRIGGFVSDRSKSMSTEDVIVNLLDRVHAIERIMTEMPNVRLTRCHLCDATLIATASPPRCLLDMLVAPLLGKHYCPSECFLNAVRNEASNSHQWEAIVDQVASLYFHRRDMQHWISTLYDDEDAPPAIKVEIDQRIAHEAPYGRGPAAGLVYDETQELIDSVRQGDSTP